MTVNNPKQITKPEMDILNKQAQSTGTLGIPKAERYHEYILNLDTEAFDEEMTPDLARRGARRNRVLLANVLFRITIVGNPRLLKFVQKFHQTIFEVSANKAKFGKHSEIDHDCYTIDRPFYENNILDRLLVNTILIDAKQQIYQVLIFDSPKNFVRFQYGNELITENLFVTYVQSTVPKNFVYPKISQTMYNKIRIQWIYNVNSHVDKPASTKDITLNFGNPSKIILSSSTSDIESDDDWKRIQKGTWKPKEKRCKNQ